MFEGKKVALIGDVGGTNIRLQLVQLVNLTSVQPESYIKKQTLLVKDFDQFEDSIVSFLKDISVQNYPQVAVIGIAGPLQQNTVRMANVPKWGTLDGKVLAQNLKITVFRFANDFQAASYGVLLLPSQQLVSLNGLNCDENKLRGVMGPGTGLGNSTLYPITLNDKKIIKVLPSQGGHTDCPIIDEETTQFFHFFSKQSGYPYISLQRSFCGPSLPYSFKFFAKKYQTDIEASENPTSQQIIQKALQQNGPRIYVECLKLFIKIYGAAVGNFIAQHMCTGGMYLLGGLTKTVLPYLKNIDFLKGYRQRHPELAQLVKKVPLMVGLQVQLGLKGAFYLARQTFNRHI